MNIRASTDGVSGYTFTALSTWRPSTLLGLPSNGHDMHSLATNVTFTNTSGTMSTVADFALTGASAGYHAGSDGKDMGADVTLVGPTGSSTPTTPTPPASVNVTIQNAVVK